MEGGSGPRGGVHNKQMFILSGFIVSDPDCIYIYIYIYSGVRLIAIALLASYFLSPSEHLMLISFL